MIAVDTSALMAIAFGEKEADACMRVLETESEVVISAGTVAEALIVAARRNVAEEVTRLIDGLGFEVVSITPASARRIAAAYERWGRGTHPAGLKFGDCFSYEIAKERACPLLYVGDDFSKTDLESALYNTVFSDRKAAKRGEKAMAKFDADTLRDLRGLQEVAIRTEKHPMSAVVIWVVVADDEVFVRSVRGSKGRWYRDLAAGGSATLEFAGRRLAVQALPASDADSIARASREFLRKYQPSPYAQSIVRAEILPTTLRLELR